MRHVLVVLLVAVVTAAACTDGADPAPGAGPQVVGASDGAVPSEPSRGRPVAGGTVRVLVPEEPDGLNPWVAADRGAAGLVTRPVLSPLWRILPNGRNEPWLLAGEPEVRTADDGTTTVVYELRSDAVWSDGQPIEGRDVLFTLRVCRALAAQARAGQPCDDVDTAASSAEGRLATVVFDRPVGSWRDLLAELPVLPEHLLADQDPAAAWSQRLPVSSGPFQFASWTPGERIVLVRNERWWGERPALDRIEVIFDDAGGLAELLDGTVDVAAVPPTLATLERARASASLRVAVGQGRALEVVDFNTASPPVGRAAVRSALTEALDVGSMVDEVVRPLAPSTRPPQGLLTVPSADGTTDASEAGRPAAGLDDAGCATGDDGVAVCDGTRMALRLAVDDGAWWHDLTAEYVRAQLAAAGVEVATADDGDGWDVRVTAVPPADPLQRARRWQCDADTNTQAYCNPAFDAVVQGADQLQPGPERDAALAEANLMLVRDRPTYPLYPVPELLVYRSAVRGPAVNTGPWGVTWNTEQWARTAGTTD